MSGKKADQITHIKNGLGAETIINYSPISEPSVYHSTAAGKLGADPGPGVPTPVTCRYPLHCHTRGIWVVSSYAVSNDISNPVEPFQTAFEDFALQYAEARSDAERGWLGFAQRIVTEGRTGRIKVTNYDNITREGTSYPFAFVPSQEFSFIQPDVPAGPAHLFTTITHRQVFPPLPPNEAGPFSVRVQDTTSSEEIIPAPISFDLQLAAIFDTSLPRQTVSTATTTFEHDVFDNVTRRKTFTPKGDVDEILSYFDNQPDATPIPWLIGILRETDETSRARSGESVTRTTTYDVYPSGLLKTVTVEPTPGPNVHSTATTGDPSLRSTTTYDRDGFGRVTTVTIAAAATADDPSGPGPLTRVNTITYDALDGVYPTTMTTQVTDSLALTTTLAYHLGLGVPVVETSPNNFTTSFDYDGFGRLRGKHAPGQGDIQVSYELPPPTPPGQTFVDEFGAAYAVHASEVGGGESIITYDQIGHETRRRVRGSDGQFSLIDTLYTVLSGQIGGVSRPYLPGQQRVLTRFTYDFMNRLRKVTLPDSQSATYSYEPRANDFGVVVHETNPMGGKHDIAKDDLGRIKTRTDFETTGTGPTSATTAYSYGPFSTLEVVDPPPVSSGSQFVSTRVVMTYDQRGRRIDLVDPDAGHNKRSYNAFGEVVKEIDGNNQVTTIVHDRLGRVTQTTSEHDGINSYVWDTKPQGLGKLGTSTSFDGVTVDYAYEAVAGRLGARTWTIQGTAFTVAQQYNEVGRLREIDYPAVGGDQLQVMFDHDAVGHVSGVRRIGSNPLAYWTVDHRLPDSRIDHETFNDGSTTTQLTFDTLRGWLTDIFTENKTLADPKIQQLHYDHDFNGNIFHSHDGRSGVDENFTYTDNEMLQTWTFTNGAPATSWSYSFNPQLDGTLQGRLGTGPGAEALNFTNGESGFGGPHAVTSVNGQHLIYDLKGNQLITRTSATVSYTSFNLPQQITQGSTSTHFTYDASNTRVVKDTSVTTSTQTQDDTTIYIGGLYEQRTRPDGAKTHVFYMPGANRVVAQETWTESGTTTSKTVLYMHDDIVGSVDSISTPTGGVTHLKYDPFGGRIDPTNPTISGTPAIDVTAGFTFHEMDDDVGLVNMRGRVYDPKLGRFVAADPFITAPFVGKAYDRYAYVFNNPLRFVDPSGFDDDDPDYSSADPGVVEQAGLQAETERVLAAWAERDAREKAEQSSPEGAGLPQQTIDDFVRNSSSGDLADAWSGVPLSVMRGAEAFDPVHSQEKALRLLQVPLAPGQQIGKLADLPPPSAEATVLADTWWEAVEKGRLDPALSDWTSMRFVYGVVEGIGPITSRAAELVELAEGAFSPIVEGGGLAAHEAAGGHLLEFHVGLDAAALDARLAAQGNLTAASSFATRAEAEAAGSAILGQNSGAISAWTQAGAAGRLTVSGAFSGGTIRVLGGFSAEATGAKFVLQGNRAGGFFILTGFPVP